MNESILKNRQTQPERGASFFYALMKWICVRDGVYKFVDNDDPRPSVKLPTKKISIPFVPFQPSWKQYEGEIWNDSTKRSVAATDKFLGERDYQTQRDPQAARWEASRKERLAKDKPAWVKWATREGIR
jgi:hypothetical protein